MKTGTGTHLTPQESKMLVAVGYGFSDAEISKELGIEVKTVAVTLLRAKNKLKAATITQAYVKALLMGLFEPDSKLIMKDRCYTGIRRR